MNWGTGDPWTARGERASHQRGHMTRGQGGEPAMPQRKICAIQWTDRMETSSVQMIARKKKEMNLKRDQRGGAPALPQEPPQKKGKDHAGERHIRPSLDHRRASRKKNRQRKTAEQSSAEGKVVIPGSKKKNKGPGGTDRQVSGKGAEIVGLPA